MSELRGIMPPLATPFDENEEINEVALKAEVRYMIEEAEVHGVVVGGSTGEGHTLTTKEARQLVSATCDAAAGDVPVIAGMIVDSTRQAVERVKALSDLPIAALQVTPVHYLFKPNDEMMQRHFAAIANATHIPVMIYNVVPWSYCSPALLTKIMSEVDGVIGVKQSAGDMKLLADLMLLLEEQGNDKGIVFSAVDALLYPTYMLGAHGSIAAILTAAPGLCVQQWDAAQRGDHATALEIHKKLLRIWNAMPHENLPANIKTAMRLQGRDGGLPRAPMQQSSPEQEAGIQQALQAAGLI